MLLASLVPSLSAYRWIGYLLTLLSGGCLLGCASLNPQPPIEAFANKLADEAIIPAVREGLAQGVEHLTIQAGAQGINPTYAVNFEGKWVVGVEGRATVGVEGVAGQLQISSTSTEETETSPHARDSNDATQPQSDERKDSAPTAGSGSPASASAVSTAPPSSVTVTITDVDADENKGFGRLDDGTLVVVLGAANKLGQTVTADVTAVAATRGGRLITARVPDGN
ncbi:MAG: hypothetical protein CHACPFDD_03133 [Phycisphaerae bacterium]|nr:hypothetical protein [Phycisphaerae bacterium]